MHMPLMQTHPQPAVYVVFGATGGIGSALSQRLARHGGAAVVLVGRDQGKLDGLQALLSPACTSSTLIADVTDSKQVCQTQISCRHLGGMYVHTKISFILTASRPHGLKDHGALSRSR